MTGGGGEMAAAPGTTRQLKYSEVRPVHIDGESRYQTIDIFRLEAS
jgi:hypothetical protein